MSYVKSDLEKAYENYKKDNPNVYLRNAAKSLNVSEVELLSLSCGNGTYRLKTEMEPVITKLTEANELTAICRNDSAVSEITGELTVQELDENLFHLRIQESEINIPPKKVASIFAAQVNNRFSIQVFDTSGNAVQKFFLKGAHGMEQFFKDFSDLFSEDQSKETSVASSPHTLPVNDQTQSEEYEFVKVPNSLVRAVLTDCTQHDIPISLQVENGVSNQIFRGTIENVKDARGWFNILDPKFNLHLKEEDMQETFLATFKGKQYLIGKNSNQPVLTIKSRIGSTNWDKIFIGGPICLKRQL